MIYYGLVMFSSVCVCAQDMSTYQKKWLVQGADTLPYRVLLPEHYDPKINYPVIFFLHGAGERGDDNETQLQHGSKLFLRSDIRKDYPAIVVFPQCSPGEYWSNVVRTFDSSRKVNYTFLEAGNPTTAMELLQTLVKFILIEYPVKKDQVYVGGLSMGGMGTFELVRRSPGIFAAAFPICGGANVSTANQMKKVSWWIFHGKKDDIVSPIFSEKIAAALKKQQADVKFTLYPGANHNSWDPAFEEPGLLLWLFAQRKK